MGKYLRRNRRVDLRRKYHVGDILVNHEDDEAPARCRVVSVRRESVRVKVLKGGSDLYKGMYTNLKFFQIEHNWKLAMNGIQRARSVLKRENRR